MYPPKQHCTVIIYHGEGEVTTGRGSCPPDCRGGPSSCEGGGETVHTVNTVSANCKPV